MSNRWISQSGAGTLAGTSFANRAPISDFVAQEAAVGTGETLFFSAETITLPFALTRTGLQGKRFVGVNATTGMNDGSIAVLDAGNTYANCMLGGAYHHNENLEFIRATGTGFLMGTDDTSYNIKARNNGAVGILASASGGGAMTNVHTSNNTTNGVTANFSSVTNLTSNGNSYGIRGSYGTIEGGVLYGNTTGASKMLSIKNCVIDGNTTGVDNASAGITTLIKKCSITNNTTGLSTSAAVSDRISEAQNYFYNNTTKIGGTVANTFSLGGSIDGAIDPYVNRAGNNFKPSATAPGLNFATPIGLLSEATNISYENMGLNPDTSSTAPTFAGITKFEILSNNKFYVEWAAGTGTITGYKIYVRNATNPFGQKPITVDSTLTSAIICTSGEMASFFQGGTTYYCGVRADNNGTNDGNTVELSNICSGAELIQRMTVTQPVISL